MAYAATKADGDLLGSWWSEDRGGYIQPTELLLGRGGTVLGAIYASGQWDAWARTRPFTTSPTEGTFAARKRKRQTDFAPIQ